MRTIRGGLEEPDVGSANPWALPGFSPPGPAVISAELRREGDGSAGPAWRFDPQ